MVGWTPVASTPAQVTIAGGTYAHASLTPSFCISRIISDAGGRDGQARRR